MFASAQYGLGARVGVNLATIIGVRSSDKVVPNPGLTTSISGEFRLVNSDLLKLYVQPELALDQKGYGTRYKGLAGYWSESQYNFDYLSLPVAVKLIFGQGRFKGGLNMGFAPSLLVGAYSTYRNSDGDRSRTAFTRSNVRAYDLNAFLGGVLEFELGPGAIFAEFRYTQGFFDPFTSFNAKPNSGSNYMHASPSISVGYVFRIGKSNQPRPTAEVEPETIDLAAEENQGENIQEEKVQDTRPDEIDEVADSPVEPLKVAPQPRKNTATTSSDFEEMIALNKHFDTVADIRASNEDKEVSKTEILSRFKHADVLVKIEIDNVPVDYYSISEFLEYIRLNHFRYKITDRTKDEDGLISEIRMHRIG